MQSIIRLYFERSVSLDPFRESAVALDAPVSAILLENIFFPGGPLHDGAVIVRGDTISAASCIFPLTTSPGVQRRLGTRHRAAMGLAEETDAIAMVVSEETGAVSVAERGELNRGLTIEDLRPILSKGLGKITITGKTSGLQVPDNDSAITGG